MAARMTTGKGQRMKEQSATVLVAMDPETFRKHRERLKASQKALADALDVHFKTVGRWERGVVPVPEAVARLIERMKPADVTRFARKGGHHGNA